MRALTTHLRRHAVGYLALFVALLLVGDVVAGALFAVAQDGVGLGRFLEFLFGLLVALVAIRVVLERQLAIRALDFLIGCCARDFEGLVIIALAHDALATFTIAGRSRRSPSL